MMTVAFIDAILIEPHGVSAGGGGQEDKIEMLTPVSAGE